MCATQPTIICHFINFTCVFDIVWIIACGLNIILRLFLSLSSTKLHSGFITVKVNEQLVSFESNSSYYFTFLDLPSSNLKKKLGADINSLNLLVEIVSQRCLLS